MASDCRINKLESLFQFRISLFKFSLFLYIVGTSVNVCVGISFDCAPVNAAKKCRCDRGNENGWETMCPAGLLEEYPIALNVLPYKEHDQALLRIRCIHQDANFPWEKVGGVDLGREGQGFRITKLEISHCSPLPITDGFHGFFKQININGSHVEELAFTSRSVVTISLPQNFFNEMPNLRILELSNNQLQTVPNLSSLEKLTTLNLKYNQLVSVPRESFANNKNLNSIQLENNKLTKIEKASFPDKSIYIDLKDNNISTLTYESFANLKKLRVLYLDGNPLDNYEVNTFNDLPLLEDLSLKKVDLKEFPNLSNLPKLKKLSVSRRFKPNLLYSDDRATTTFLPEGEGASTTIAPPEEIVFDIELNNLPNLTKLELVNLELINFPILKNLANLTEVNFSRNKLQIFPFRYLSELPNLTKLDLSKNNITELNLPGVNQLVELNLHDNKLTHLTPAFFKQSSQLTKLIASSNKIESITDETFESLLNLAELNLANNNLSFASKKNYLDPDTDSVASFIGSNQSPLRNNLFLAKIILNKNQIDTIYEDWKFLMQNLSKLDLRRNKFSYLHSTDFNFVQNKITVDLNENEITQVDMEDAMLILNEDRDPTNQEFSQMVTINLDDNPLTCDCQAYYLKKFRERNFNFQIDKIKCENPANIKGQNLKNVPDKELKCPVTDGCPEGCDCWKRSADYTILIDCSNRNISSSGVGLPQVSNDDIIRQLKLSHLKWKLDLLLSGNGITELNNSYALSLSHHIRLVDLSNNKLKSLYFLDALDNNNVTNFALAGNPFSCEDCSGFQNKWRPFALRLDVNNMTCIKAVDQRPELITKLDDLEVLCPQIVFSTELRILVIVVSLLLAVLVLVVAIYIRHGWAIRAFLYSKGLGCCLCYDSMDDEEDKTYDAFVSYSHKDEDWVLNELVNRLEKRDGFKLCVHIRDWIPGMFITEQIVRSVDESRRTVIVLSKNFVESIWSRLEFKTAHSQAINDKTNRLILILMGDDLTDEDVKDEDLRLYMKMNTYLKWNDPWFWHKLKYALPHKKNTLEENRNILQKREQRERAIQLDKLRAKIEQNV